MTKEYKGFLDEAIKLGAKLTTGSVTILNKETYKINDNYIGVGKEVTFEWTYKEDADVHEIDMAMDAYARSSVEHSIADQKQTKGIIGGNWELRTTQLKTEQPATVAEPASKQAFGPPAGESLASEPESHSEPENPVPVEVVKFTLARRTDGKFQLELYQMYGQNVGKYAEIKYIASREDMWKMVSDFLEGFDLTTLPIAEDVKWYAEWEHGREFKNDKGETKRYKDLVGLKQR